jgi:alpha-L-arabinofuranosidase
VEPFLIACGPDGNKPAENEAWTRAFFETYFTEWRAGRLHGYDAHFYTWATAQEDGSATTYTPAQWTSLIEKSQKVEELILQQRGILDEFDPERRIKLLIGEWGVWHAESPRLGLFWQQSALRDAVSAALTLDIFHRHADRVWMANLAQTANVLQAPLLTEPETGRLVCTPTYHVFALYKSHRGGQSLRAELPGGLSGSASQQGPVLTLSVVNASPTEAVTATLPVARGTAKVLTHATLTAHNTFDAPDTVTPQTQEVTGAEWTFPPASITVFQLQ